MTFWDGSHWVEETPASSPKHPSRLHNWAATGLMIFSLAAIAVPIQLVAAASHKHDPGVAVACDPAPCTVGGSITVTGWGYTPSSGGQQVILWVGYPNDYCGADACHGFYVDPWVASDGTFSLSVSNATEQTGTGSVSAIAYMVKQDKWVTVASQAYTVQ
jgi:hypothetical protein